MPKALISDDRGIIDGVFVYFFAFAIVGAAVGGATQSPGIGALAGAVACGCLFFYGRWKESEERVRELELNREE